MLRKKQGVGTIRYVTVMKGENEGLGISITVSSFKLSNFLHHLHLIV